MAGNLLRLSEIVIANPEVASFSAMLPPLYQLLTL